MIINDDFLEKTILLRRSTLDKFSIKLEADLALVFNLFRNVIEREGKILIFGNGGSAAQAEHLSTELMVRFSADRNPIPALCLSSSGVHLTAHANDFNFDTLFARQIEALAAPNDLCLAFSTSGKSPNIIAAAKKAREKKIPFILCTGETEVDPLNSLDMIIVSVPSRITAVIQEMHLIFLHILCEKIDSYLIK
jgi:D-sedoheptulose 7-phosphate isomerase